MHEETLKVLDEDRNEIKALRVNEIQDQFDKVKSILQKCLERLKETEDYELSNVEVGLSFKAGFFVISTEGQIKLTYQKKKR